jgi:hypothetical protein
VGNYLAEYLMVKAKLDYFTYLSKDVIMLDEKEEGKMRISEAYA